MHVPNICVNSMGVVVTNQSYPNMVALVVGSSSVEGVALGTHVQWKLWVPQKINVPPLPKHARCRTLTGSFSVYWGFVPDLFVITLLGPNLDFNWLAGRVPAYKPRLREVVLLLRRSRNRTLFDTGHVQPPVVGHDHPSLLWIIIITHHYAIDIC